MYLTYNDYKKSIQLENLTQIINSDDSIRTNAELAAVEEAKSYLIQKYDVTNEFKDTEVFSLSVAYNAATTIQVNGTTWALTTVYPTNYIMAYLGNVYYATTAHTATTGNTPTSTGNTWALIAPQYAYYNTILPADRYLADTEYSAGDIVFINNKTYTASSSTIGVEPGLSTTSAWGVGTTYTVPAGTLLSATTYYALGDVRSQQMVLYVIDILLYHLHKRINPANIPDLRVKAYDDAVKWLKMCSKGEVTPSMLLKTPRSGGRWIVNSTTKNNNSY